MIKSKILLTIASLVILASCQKNPFDGKQLYAIVEKFVSLGNHRTGTATDSATSLWLGQELAASGYDIKYIEFPVRQFFLESSSIVFDNDSIKTFPLWWVNDSIKQDVSDIIVDSRSSEKNLVLKNHIVLTRISGAQPGRNLIAELDSFINLGVKAIIAITENESGDITAFNTSSTPRPWKVPIVLAGPKDSSKLLKIIEQKKIVNLYIKGSYKNVTAHNVYGTYGNEDKYIVISTPISGWFGCGGERGPGIAVWLSLAKWAAQNDFPYTFVFTGNSGHELSGIGAHEFLAKAAPPIEKTHLWIHLGAGVATLAYTKTEKGLQKENVVDSLRSLFYSDSLKQSFDKAFATIRAQKFNVKERIGGELVYVAKKGYTRIAGAAYSHPFFHVPSDSASTTSPEILEETALAFKKFIELETKIK